MKIGFFETEGWEEKKVREAFPDAQCVFYKDQLDEQHIPDEKDFDVLSVFVNCRVSKNVLDAFPNVKCVTTRSTGYDHVDKEECKRRGIRAYYVPGYGDNTVAEFAFGLLLALSRKIYAGVDQIKETRSFSLSGLRGFDLKGKTIGIIGTGRIGKEAIRIAQGFGMNVVAFDMFPDTAFAEKASVHYVSLQEVLSLSDVISIHAPLTDSTRHIINKDNISKIKKGCVLINTARGAIVETEALVIALQNGTLGGAGLDVLEEEGETRDEMSFFITGHPTQENLRIVLANHVLMKMPNVLITPHNAFNSQEALERILGTTLGNIQAFINNESKNEIP